MAQPTKNTRAPAEPVNSEQLEGLEAAAQPDPVQTPPAPGPTTGELEERAADAEDRAAAAETRAFSLEQEMNELKAQVALLMKAQRAAGQPRSEPIEVFQGAKPGQTPFFEEDEPYGLVVGDTDIAYVQNGHQFDRAKRYLATEEHRGVPRPFNPRLIGVTKPRPGQNTVDGLADFRDDPRLAS